MPILLPHSIKPLPEQTFHQLDYEVMALAFEVHNELGRFYNEQIYQNELRQKCLNHGLKTECEFEIKLIHKNFTKSLFIDLLIDDCVYELKAIRSIQEPQRIQTLNYLFATDTRHGKIVNFRPASVEHEFTSTTLDHQSRRRITIMDAHWQPFSQSSEKLKQITLELMNDWGAYFHTQLYEEALICFLGGTEQVVQPVNIECHGKRLGIQNLNVLSNSEFFIVTAARKNKLPYKVHLQKMLQHTPFKHLYWINLNHSTIEFTTLEK